MKSAKQLNFPGTKITINEYSDSRTDQRCKRFVRGLLPVGMMLSALWSEHTKKRPTKKVTSPLTNTKDHSKRFSVRHCPAKLRV